MAHIKIALLKCKNIPPTVFPPSVLLVILLKRAIICASLALSFKSCQGQLPAALDLPAVLVNGVSSAR